MGETVRVAAVQFAVGTDVSANLATCQRMIDEAAAQGAQLVVLPEFCNHASWYDDHEHAIAVAVEPGDDFCAGIADRARHHGVHVVMNATRHAGGERVTGSNFLFGPDGALLAVTDKQVLMGAESDHLSIADEVAPIIDTPLGALGLYSCMDGVIFETPRSLALRGAKILCNSLNSFALDEASLHVPVRAAENRVWVVAANKVGPLIPPAAIAEVAQRMGLAVEQLHGAGESQIVAPDGTIVARGPHDEEAVVVADIDVSRADRKRRADGTDLLATRRPELYVPIADAPTGRRKPPGAEQVAVAVVQLEHQGERAIPEAVAAVGRAAREGAQLIVLPELFCFESGLVLDPEEGIDRSFRALAALGEELAGTQAHVATSIVAGEPGAWTHAGVLVSAEGVELVQPQLHTCARHATWATEVGGEVDVIDLPFGRFAIVLGPDSVHPEVFRMAALEDAEVVAVPIRLVEPWEVTLGLPERAAENRLCVVAATQPSTLGTSRIFSLERDFTLWTVWEERAFDGRISHPIVTEAPAEPGVTHGVVHPARTANRILTRRTDVVDSRPWKLVDALVEPATSSTTTA